jgi:hypothetical protein
MDEPIKWGDTHCPVCEKKFAQDADYDEGYRLEQTYGVDSQPVQEFDARLCWADCYDFDTILKRLGELLAERDRLRGLLGRAAQESCDHVLGRYAAQTDAKDGDA